MAAPSREVQPRALVIGSVLALLYAVGLLGICLWVITLVFEDGSRLSSNEQTGLVGAGMGVAVAGFGIFCVFRGLQRQVWAITLEAIGLAGGVLFGIGVTVTTFRADEEGVLSSGWFWLAVTLIMIVPVVLLSVSASRLQSLQEAAEADPR